MVRIRLSIWRYLVLALCYCAGGFSVFGFALLGPYAPWMVPAFTYRMPGDVGGPMDITEGYRWNVPVVTYGFDQEFVEYFGEDGIVAVDAAFAILNDLPPASAMDIDAFPLNTRMGNDLAAFLGLMDLQSAALAAILEQLGLGNPHRYMWSIRDRSIDEQGTNYTVVQRNFDPLTLEPSDYMNGSQFSYQILSIPNPNPQRVDAIELSVDVLPLFLLPFSVAAGDLTSAGWFFIGLTRDDAGGLRFLLREQNRKVERLLPGVVAGPDNSNAVVNVALRPGIEKVNFLRMSTRDGAFVAVTNVFVDHFFTNGMVSEQQLQRVVLQPDILFRAKDLGLRTYGRTNYPPLVYPPLLTKRDNSHWQNNADLNSQPAAAGPGIIRPGGEITFNKTGRYSQFMPTSSLFVHWANFDGSTNIVVHQGNERATSASIKMGIVRDGDQALFEWLLLLRENEIYRIEATTDFKDWMQVGSVMATNENFAIFRSPVSGSSRCYRAVLETSP